MAVKTVFAQEITDRYALYNGDCIEVLQSLPDRSIDLSIYSPPFSDLYSYSSSDNDMSNSKTYAEFLQHYEFLVKDMARLTKPGRLSCVHCMDIQKSTGWMVDFPGDIIRIHERHGWHYHGRYSVWKEPLRIALRTRLISLMHKQIVKDSARCSMAAPDTLLMFRRAGDNAAPIAHPMGLSTYSGARKIPWELVEKYRGWKEQKTNKLSHWIWQQYASPFWDDIRVDRLLPYKKARGEDDEKHICPLQLDVIERCLTLWSNPGDTVLTPFMGIGSEVYGAVQMGRRGVGVELKPTYYRQAVQNVQAAEHWRDDREQGELFVSAGDDAARDDDAGEKAQDWLEGEL